METESNHIDNNDSPTSSQQQNKEEAEEEDETVLSNFPMVFQCLQCLQIIGDSFSVVGACGEHSVTLKALPGGFVDEEKMLISTEGPDQKSAYNPVYCTKCKATLGRWYFATPPHLFTLHNNFALFQNTFCSYQLGTGITNSSEDGGSPSTQQLSIHNLYSHLALIQRGILALSERMAMIEQAMPQQPSSSSSSTKKRKRTELEQQQLPATNSTSSSTNGNNGNSNSTTKT
ncbi:Protein Mis18-alpha [Balamuthia mandrillaris]